MALGRTRFLLAIVLLTLFWAETSTAQSNCAAAIMSLSPCLTFSTQNSSPPSSACCSQLASMVQTTPLCLCEVMNGGGADVLGLVLNRTLAQALPRACNLRNPPLSNCDDGLGSQSSTSSDGVSSDGAYSSGNNVKIPILLAILLTLIASYGPVILSMI